MYAHFWTWSPVTLAAEHHRANGLELFTAGIRSPGAVFSMTSRSVVVRDVSDQPIKYQPGVVVFSSSRPGI